MQVSRSVLKDRNDHFGLLCQSILNRDEEMKKSYPEHTELVLDNGCSAQYKVTQHKQAQVFEFTKFT